MFDQMNMIKNFLLHFDTTVLLVLNEGTSWDVNWLPESSSSFWDCRRNARSSSSLPYLDPILFCFAFNNICNSTLLGFTRNSKIYFIITTNDMEDLVVRYIILWVLTFRKRMQRNSMRVYYLGVYHDNIFESYLLIISFEMDNIFYSSK